MSSPELAPTITEARIYPVKGCRPVVFNASHNLVPIAWEGLGRDREFMVVGEHDRSFRTQRKRHGGQKLALINTAFGYNWNTLRLWADGLQEITVGVHPKINDKHIEVEVWGDRCQATVLPEATDPLSEFLGQRVLLVRKASQRLINRPASSPRAEVGFVDRYQIMAISQATLNHFNDLLESEYGYKVLMDSFRPNLILGNCGDRQENNIVQARLGEVELSRAKQCERCEVPAIDQGTAQMREGILETLRAYYRPFHNHPPLFGEQFNVTQTGMIPIGETLQVTERDQGGWSRPLPKKAT